MEFKVVKINQEFRKLVVPITKRLIEAELEEQKKQIISGLRKDKFWKVWLKTSLHTVSSSTSVALMALSTLH